MKDYMVKDIRNIAVLGHGSEGKTTLVEAMLYAAGVIDRQGRVEDGNTVSDYDPEEAKRHISISAAVAPIEIHNKKINLLDVPGYFDFAEIQAMRRRPMYMSDYVENLDRILASTGEALLTDGGTVSHTQAMEKAKAEYRKYQAQNLSPVEEEYLQAIRSIEKAAKEGEKR